MLLTIFIIFAIVVLFLFNNLTQALITRREIPAERQKKVFQTINTLLTILLLTSYLDVWSQVR